MFVCLVSSVSPYSATLIKPHGPCEYLLDSFCAYINKKCPKVTISSLYAISAYEMLHPLLSNNGGEICILLCAQLEFCKIPD